MMSAPGPPREKGSPLWRQLLSILLLPTTVVIVVPLWLRSALADLDTEWTGTSLALAGRVTGVIMFVTGLVLFSWCIVLFAKVGRGTLAPWDPTKRLVAVGPYRHVRNPMISAVAAMLIGEAVFLGSAVLAGWSVVFIMINHAYFLLSEEPGLEKRFGSAYLEYKRQVPRWMPRIS